MKLFNELSKFILHTSSKFKIDESHNIIHSMNVLHFAHNIYQQEVHIHPGLKEHRNIIYLSATLHDMCDNKYMDDDDGLYNIKKFLKTDLKYNEK